MRRRLLVLLALVVAMASSATAAGLPTMRIGMVVDGPWVGNQQVRDETIAEIRALTEDEFDVQFPESAYLIGDWTLDTARRQLDSLLADPEVDLVITWGLLSSYTVCCYVNLPKPVVAPVVIDVEIQGIPYAAGTSGFPNLSYVALPNNLDVELRRFRDVVHFERVAILANAALLEAIPELAFRTRQKVDLVGDLDFEYVAVRDSADEVLDALSPDVDAVYTWPLFQLAPPELTRLIKGLNERRLPTFSWSQDELTQGMLVSNGALDFLSRLTRRVALNVQRILLGEEPGSIPVAFDVRGNLAINMATARAIGVSPRWQVLIEAELVNAEETAGVRRLTLASAVEEAVTVNLDLVVRRRVVAAGEQEVARARAALLPQLDLLAQQVQLDDDRAAASFGSQAERTTSASATLTQLLYSDAALGNVAIQSYLQEARQLDLETLRLDIALEAATAYLNLMRARALERVQRNNVEQVRSNLELAEVRRSIGVAGAGEVLRWESELASGRKTAVEAVVGRISAEIALNRILHRPADDHFLPVDVNLETLASLAEERFDAQVETPRTYEVFSDYIVLEGLTRAPELEQLDAGIAAQRRFLETTRRAFWSPTLALQASFEELLSRGGAGSEGGGIPGFSLDLPTADDTNWSIAFNAALPLYAGGERAAERVQAEIDLERLSLERTAVEEKIEQRIRTALQQARGSFVGIRLSEQAADAASRNLELVEDSYARGAASLLDLLDAQTADFNTEELAANALYDFLIDWLEAQRAANVFELLMDPEEGRMLIAGLEAYRSRREAEDQP